MQNDVDFYFIFIQALFKEEYNPVQRDSHGVLITHGLGIYSYECCKFPGYYICWRGDDSVDCEVSMCMV